MEPKRKALAAEMLAGNFERVARFQYELSGSTKQFTIYSDSAHGDETVTRFAFVNPRTTMEDVRTILDSMR